MNLREELFKETLKAIVKVLVEQGIKRFYNEVWPRWQADFKADFWSALQELGGAAFFGLFLLAAACDTILIGLAPPQSVLLPMLGPVVLVGYAWTVWKYNSMFLVRNARFQ